MFQWNVGELLQHKDYNSQQEFLGAIATFKENISLLGIKGKEFYEEVDFGGKILHLSTYEVNVGTYQVRFRAVEYTQKD